MPKNARHWLDGKPYYCAVCGLGYGKYLACEDGDCELESEEDAAKRASEHQSGIGGEMEQLSEAVFVRLTPTLLKRIDKYRRRQDRIPTTPEAIRKLIEQGLYMVEP